MSKNILKNMPKVTMSTIFYIAIVLFLVFLVFVASKMF